MHTFMDAKLMAKLLRQGLADRNIDLPHSDCLELVSRQFGFANWNILSAKIESMVSRGDGDLPQGWIRSGKGTRLFRTGLDREIGAAWIESRPEHVDFIRDDDFCTIMQTVDAGSFRGQRVRVASQLRAEAADGVTIWFRIDGPMGSLRFENLERYQIGGPLTGTTNWIDRSIVLDVPAEATSLNYGFYLKGNGRGWAKGFALDIVDASEGLNTPDGSALPGPTNLGFTDAA